MGFSYSTSLSGSAPITRKMQVGETCYTGQLLMNSHATANCIGNTWLLDVAAKASEDDHPVLGLVTGVHTTNDAGWSASNYGDTATADSTQAAMVANDPVDLTLVEMTVVMPYIVVLKGPIYNAAYGTAITTLTCTGASSGGTDIADTGSTAIDYADDYGTAYCRTGANRGHYRTLKTGDTTTNVVQAPFPYGIAIGDTFVTGPGVPGITGLQTGGTANYINAAEPSTASAIYYDVWLHELNLEESGKEYAVFAFLAGACGGVGFLGT